MAKGQAVLALVVLSILLRGSIQATITQPITTAVSDATSSTEAAPTTPEQVTTSTQPATATEAATTTTEPTTTTTTEQTTTTTTEPTTTTTEATTTEPTTTTTEPTTTTTEPTTTTTEPTTTTTEATTTTTEPTTATTEATTTTTEPTTTTEATTTTTESTTTTTEQTTTEAATTTAEPATTTMQPATTTEPATSTMEPTTTTVATTTASDNAIKVCKLEPKDCKTMSFNMTGCFCYCPHKPHPNTGMFIMSVGPVDYAMHCPYGLVWNQEKCMCDNPPTKASAVDAIKALPAFTSGCKTLVNYVYNATSKAFEDGRNFVRQENNINKIQVVQSEGATVNNNAADFVYNSIDIPYLNGNDLTDTAFIEVRIKPVADRDNVTRVILSNGCDIDSTGETSVIMSFNAEEGNFYVAVRTAYLSNGVCENMEPDVNGWYKLTLSVKDSNTRFLVNDRECLTFKGRGNIAKTTCNLSIGGNPFMSDYSQDFNGYIDYVKVIKHCSTEPPK